MYSGRGANHRPAPTEVHTLYVIEAGGSPARRRESLKKPDIRKAIEESRALLAELAHLRPQVEAIGVRFKTVVVYLGNPPQSDLRAFAGRPNLEAVVSNAATTARLAAAGVVSLPALVTPTTQDQGRPAYDGFETILDLYLGAVGQRQQHGGGHRGGRRASSSMRTGGRQRRKPKTRDINVEDYLQQQIGHPDDDMDEDDYGDEGMDTRELQRRAADLEAARAAKRPPNPDDRRRGGGGNARGSGSSSRPPPVVPRVDDGPEQRFSQEDIDDFDLDSKFSAGIDDFDDDMLNDYLQDAMDGF